MPFWNTDTELSCNLLEKEVARQALLIAYINDFQLIMSLTILSIPIALLRRNLRTRSEYTYEKVKIIGQVVASIAVVSQLNWQQPACS